MKNVIIRTNNLTKYYGKKRGIIDVNLEVTEGEIFGYLGPNGAGKTTTIRIFLDFIRADRGKATLFGLDTWKDSIAVHRKIGYLSGELFLYNDLTVNEFLLYIGNLRKSVSWNYVEELADRFNCNLTQKIRTLSHGNKQKVGLIQAFMHKPELLILDEPTSGLDPLMRHEFFRLLSELKSEGKTVFLSSHVLSEVEHICDRVGIIRNGRLGVVEEITKMQLRGLYYVEIHFSEDVPLEGFKTISNINDLSVVNRVLKCRVVGDMDQLLKYAAKFKIKNLTSHQPSLEETFLAHYGDQNNVS